MPTLSSGTRLGSYEVISLVGAGGVGEVYRARDTRLHRDVALKILPAAVTNDAQRVGRLEREAQAVAALQHPNICAIHDIGHTAAGEPYLVMELLEGETLQQRLTRGPQLTPLTDDARQERVERARRGLAQLGRFDQMDAILRKLRQSEGSVAARIEKLKQDLSCPTTEAGRTQIMTDIDGVIRDAEKRAVQQFDRRPKAPVVAQPYPRFMEATAAAGYNAPPLDGSRPGIFQMPLRPNQMTKFALRTLVYHETVPGHHFQMALMREDQSLPKFRQAGAFGNIAAVTEGWALYAERLAAESGWYSADLEGLLGQLDDELFRARRLVVDTGLHVKKWTRQQAIDHGIEPSEVERYVVNPGQACAYMIGQLKILELRDKAKSALGSRFSERAFHDAILGAGVVPLTLLEREVDGYINANRR